MTSPRKILHGLTANDFRHTLDREATNQLKQLPGLDLIVRNLLGDVAEKFFYLDNIAASILVGPNQLPDLHELLTEACTILEIDPPQLYVKQNPVPNAYTLAMRGQQPFVVIHTSLIELLTPAEIQAVIAHELGHLKCEHGVYLTIANIMGLAANLLPLGSQLLTQSLQTRILQWVRCAEFSCDRAAALVAQDSRVVMSVLMKLCGGSPSLAHQLNLDAFIDQARSYQAIVASDLGQILQENQTSQLTHPLPVLRAKEIDRWASSPNYSALFKKCTMNYNKKSTKGEWRNW